MESHEQAFFRADDSHLNYDANFCSVQSGVQLQFDSECPVTLEPSTLDSSALQETGINMTDQHIELVTDDAGDDNSVLANGKGPGSSDSGFNKKSIGSSDESRHMNEASTADNAVRAGVCIGTIISVHEQANTISAKQFAGEATRAHKVQVTASSGKPGNRIDYGESVAIEDFGGEFEDGHGIEEFSFPSTNVFTDNEVNKPDTVNVTSVEANENDGTAQTHAAEVQELAKDTALEEQLDVPESLDKILPKSPADVGSMECEEEPPILEREVISKAGNSKQNDKEENDGDMEETLSKLPSRRSRHRGDAESGRKQASDTEQSPASNVELNVNSRPRRSVNRKSVLELLHVDYRYVGGPKKVATHRASEGEVDHESPAKKQRSSKKGTKLSVERAGDSTERPAKTKRLLPMKRDNLHDIDDQIDALKKKVVGYMPDDFLDDGDAEDKVTKNAEEKDKKSALDADTSTLKESVFAEAEDMAARSFLSTFAAESAEALSSSKETGDIGSELDALTTENQELKSRIKALEQSKSLMKKFNIDFHGRKFSRIRSPAVASPDQQQKTSGKIGGVYDSAPAAERKVPVETGESMLSQIAVLNRREHKLRELNAELDERATSVKIAEGALRRRERKLLDFEKTLEHRERVLSRHEQSILKRELMLGSPDLPAGYPPEEEGEDRQSLAAEIQRRLEQRRLELDRRQAALNSERTRLDIREQELDRREASSRMAVENVSSADESEDGDADNAHRNSNHPSKRLTSTGNRKSKTSMSRSIRSKYFSPKKQKVLVGF